MPVVGLLTMFLTKWCCLTLNKFIFKSICLKFSSSFLIVLYSYTRTYCMKVKSKIVRVHRTKYNRRLDNRSPVTSVWSTNTFVSGVSVQTHSGSSQSSIGCTYTSVSVFSYTGSSPSCACAFCTLISPVSADV